MVDSNELQIMKTKKQPPKCEHHQTMKLRIMSERTMSRQSLTWTTLLNPRQNDQKQNKTHRLKWSKRG